MNTESRSILKSRAIAAFDGNASALARALKISPQAVYQWPDGAIPEEQALKLRFVLLPNFRWDVPTNDIATNCEPTTVPAE